MQNFFINSEIKKEKEVNFMRMEMVQQAKEVLQEITQRTPLIDASKIYPNLWIKAESLQKTGSFKLRGATYKISQLSEIEKKRGIVAASAGNHAQGVGFACQRWAIDGIIVMPMHAPLSKIESTRSYGVDVQLVGDSFQEAYEYAKELAKKTNRCFIEPFDDELVIAGQGTVALEILEKMPDVEVVVVPIGGGGLAAGIAYVIKTLKPTCKVIGVQAKGAPSMKESLDKQERLVVDVTTMADGIAVKQPGILPFEFCQKYIDEVVLVSEQEIAATMVVLLEKMKLVAEGAGAVATAAVLFDKVKEPSSKIVSILSGGNIDVQYLSQIIDLGLIKTDRKFSVNFYLSDRPGNLKKIVDVLSNVGANILSIEHDRLSNEVLNHQCLITLVLETTGKNHKEKVLQELKEAGYEIEIKRGEFIATTIEE